MDHVQATKTTAHSTGKADHMDFEAAMHRTKALFSAIWELAKSGDHHDAIMDLASLGESIIEDQLRSEE
jgi:hypothetical protein